MIARLEDSDFEAPFKVVSYKIGAKVAEYRGILKPAMKVTGGLAMQQIIVSRATPGTQIFFDEIRVIGPDGKQREITPMVFSLK